MAVIHFSENFIKRMMKGFNQAAETDSLFTHELDMEFSGVYTVHLKSVKTEPLQKYDKSKSIDAGSRYGTTTEVGDEEQTFTMTQDDSLSLSIDRGNNEGQFNMKKAGDVMNAEKEEQIVPHLDTYRLAKWAQEAGIHVQLTEAPKKTTICQMLVDQHNDMLDKSVPDKITLVISRKYLPMLKLSPEWVGLDSLGGKTLPKGTMGEFDGMAVKPITSKKMPANVPWMMIYAGAVIAPMKIQKFKGHEDPPGLSGDLLEFRMIHDAFVIGKRANGISVACLPGTMVETPTVEMSSNNATLTSKTGSAVIKYTLDGSDPRYSKDAKTYTAPVALKSGDKLRAYASKEEMYNSAVMEKDCP